MKSYIVRTIKRKRGSTYEYEYRDKRGKPLSQKRVKEATEGLYLPPP